jgi:hypothetical protein
MKLETIQQIYPNIIASSNEEIFYDENGDNVNIELDKFAKDSDNNYYEYYILTPDENGIFQPDYNALKPKLKQELEDYYNSDSFRTVNIDGYTIPNRRWIRNLAKEGIVAYVDKITRGIINRNDTLPISWEIDGQIIPLTYDFLCIVNEDLARMINALFLKVLSLGKELDSATDSSYINNWLVNSKAELDNYKATL